MPETPRSGVSGLLVALQLAAVAGCVAPLGSSTQGARWWLASTGTGAALAIYVLAHNRIGNFSIFPEPPEAARLITSGPYRWVRHPMYVALVLLMLGAAGFNGHAVNLASLFVLILVVDQKARREERYLAARFDGYLTYVERVARFVPGLY